MKLTDEKNHPRWYTNKKSDFDWRLIRDSCVNHLLRGEAQNEIYRVSDRFLSDIDDVCAVSAGAA